MFADKTKVATLIENNNAILIDMRDAVTFRDFKIEGSINLPSVRTLTNYLMLEKDKKRPVILFASNPDDEDLKAGINYSENLGFTTYITDVRQLR